MKASVLILDGDRWQREALAAALAYEGCQAEHTGDAASAMALLARQSFHLILFDPSAPATGGWATIERLILLHPELPVIVLAPSKGEEHTHSASLTDANHGIKKPINFAALGSAIERALSKPTETIVLHCTEREEPGDTMLPSFVATGSFASNSATQFHA